MVYSVKHVEITMVCARVFSLELVQLSSVSEMVYSLELVRMSYSLEHVLDVTGTLSVYFFYSLLIRWQEQSLITAALAGNSPSVEEIK